MWPGWFKYYLQINQKGYTVILRFNHWKDCESGVYYTVHYGTYPLCWKTKMFLTKKTNINIYKHNTIIWKGKTKHVYLKYCTVKYNKYYKDKS